MHHAAASRASYCRTAWLALLFAVIGTTSAIALAAPARGDAPLRTQAAQFEYPVPTDTDGDGVVDDFDFCRLEPGDLRNGCPSELNAEVRGRWQVNRLLTKITRLTVVTPIGSRIELRCSGRIKICGKREHVIYRTTHRFTSLLRYFKKPRIYRAHLNILIKVTKSEKVGYYKRYKTRTGRKAPTVTERCLSPAGRVLPCDG